MKLNTCWFSALLRRCFFQTVPAEIPQVSVVSAVVALIFLGGVSAQRSARGSRGRLARSARATGATASLSSQQLAPEAQQGIRRTKRTHFSLGGAFVLINWANIAKIGVLCLGDQNQSNWTKIRYKSIKINEINQNCRNQPKLNKSTKIERMVQNWPTQSKLNKSTK